MWVTFAPCLYIFVDYYFHHVSTFTINAIHSLSSIYMLLYPLVVYFTFGVFDDISFKNDQVPSHSTVPGSGLRRGILIGAVLNVIGSGMRWFGAIPSLYGFLFLFIGQSIAALAQVFMLAIPPQLAVAWFPESEINVATSIAVSANNLGIAIGCLWSPWAIHLDTMLDDIPHLLLLQFIMCTLVILIITVAFQKQPPCYTQTSVDISNSNVDSTTQRLFKEKNFILLLLSYGVIFGAQCAIITLIDQILLPPFTGIIVENDVGILSCVTLFVGVLGSILVGHYLDNTKKYRLVCGTLSILTSFSMIVLYISIEWKSFWGVAFSCIGFGASSYSIAPAIFQYCGELFYPVNEIIPTGYLFLIGNIGGVILVAFMGWTENTDSDFNMRWPMIYLLIAVIIGSLAMIRVNGPLKRSLTTILV
ncbi:major facilitator superfamily domain-containing protein [Halteromyces radiatus]|uniref:major facilitator superfamily domain-containing protein n=1 Tax=Halteromyces radiatus TaxID=101107 RepID=UPI002220FCA4|nr:major facilitator superfamily domain-containing protein [Halteromyces radiatus]KAI8093232.1 major facilitator superfamily domain-containing protein [Halteromyces radiatus]